MYLLITYFNGHVRYILLMRLEASLSPTRSLACMGRSLKISCIMIVDFVTVLHRYLHLNLACRGIIYNAPFPYVCVCMPKPLFSLIIDCFPFGQISQK